MVLIDTSLYVEASIDEEIRRALKTIGASCHVNSCQVIHDKEIEDACTFLRKRGQSDKAEILKDTYNNTFGGIIKITPLIRRIVDEYKTVALTEKILSQKQFNEMCNDFIIIASASVAGVKTIYTINRKTMSCDRSLKIYNKVNKRNGIGIPRIVSSKKDLLEFANSL